MPIDLTFQTTGTSFQFDSAFYNQFVLALQQYRPPEALQLSQSAAGVVVHHEPEPDGTDPLLPGNVVIRDVTDWNGLASDDVRLVFDFDPDYQLGHLVGGNGGPYGPVTVKAGGSISWTWNTDLALAGLPAGYLPRRWGASVDGRPLPAVAVIRGRAEARVRVTTHGPTERVQDLAKTDAVGTRRLVHDDMFVYQRTADQGTDPALWWTKDTAVTWVPLFETSVSVRVDRSIDPDLVHGLHPDLKPEADQIALEQAQGVRVKLHDLTSFPARARSAARKIRVYQAREDGTEIAGTSEAAVLVDPQSGRDILKTGVSRSAAVEIESLGRYVVEAKYKVCYATEDSVASYSALPTGQNGDIAVVTGAGYDDWTVYTHDGSGWDEASDAEGLIEEVVVTRSIRVYSPVERPVPATSPPSAPIARVVPGNGAVALRYGARIKLYSWTRTSGRRNLVPFLHPGTQITSTLRDRLMLQAPAAPARTLQAGLSLNAAPPVRAVRNTNAGAQQAQALEDEGVHHVSVAQAIEIENAAEVIRSSLAYRPGGYVYTYEIQVLPGEGETAATLQTFLVPGQLVRLPGHGVSLRVLSVETAQAIELFSKMDDALGLVPQLGMTVRVEGIMDPTIPTGNPDSMVEGWTSPVGDALAVEVRLRYGLDVSTGPVRVLDTAEALKNAALPVPLPQDVFETRTRLVDPRTQFPEVLELLSPPTLPYQGGESWHVSARAASAWTNGAFRESFQGEVEAETMVNWAVGPRFEVHEDYVVAKVQSSVADVNRSRKGYELYGRYSWVADGAATASVSSLHLLDANTFLPRPKGESLLQLTYQWRTRGGSVGPILTARSTDRVPAHEVVFGPGIRGTAQGLAVRDVAGDTRVVVGPRSAAYGLGALNSAAIVVNKAAVITNYVGDLTLSYLFYDVSEFSQLHMYFKGRLTQAQVNYGSRVVMDFRFGFYGVGGEDFGKYTVRNVFSLTAPVGQYSDYGFEVEIPTEAVIRGMAPTALGLSELGGIVKLDAVHILGESGDGNFTADVFQFSITAVKSLSALLPDRLVVMSERGMTSVGASGVTTRRVETRTMALGGFQIGEDGEGNLVAVAPDGTRTVIASYEMPDPPDWPSDIVVSKGSKDVEAEPEDE